MKFLQGEETLENETEVAETWKFTIQEQTEPFVFLVGGCGYLSEDDEGDMDGWI